MKSLKDILADEGSFGAIVADCVQLIDDEVASKGGLSGVAVKAGYKVVQGAKPGFVENVVRSLLPDFASVLDPICAEAAGKGQGVSAYFSGQTERVADALLSVTDGKAAGSSNAAVKGAYGKLRGSAKKNVVAAVPGLASIIERHVS